MSLKSYRREVKKFLDGKATQKTATIGTEVTNHIKKSMRETKSGEEYRIPGSDKTYIASAPGEYPAIRTSQLRSGIRFKLVPESDGVAVHMGTNVDQGIYLEGEGDGIRPWLSKGMEEFEPRLKEVLGDWE